VASDPSETPKHSVSVAAAIVDDAGRFLVIRRADNGQWEPPGGVLELDESIHDGLVREVFEEAGLHVKPVSLTGVYKNMDRGIVALVFRCDIIEGTPHATPEAREVAWLEPDKLASHLSDAYAIRLRDASDLSSAPDVRAHDGANIYPRTIAGESSMK
jgi:ADP-ribose pyrophosphatase YjhB (NUDIX family)